MSRSSCTLICFSPFLSHTGSMYPIVLWIMYHSVSDWLLLIVTLYKALPWPVLIQCMIPAHIHRCRWVSNAINSPGDEWQLCPCLAAVPDVFFFSFSCLYLLNWWIVCVVFLNEIWTPKENKDFQTDSNYCHIWCVTRCMIILEGLSV